MFFNKNSFNGTSFKIFRYLMLAGLSSYTILSHVSGVTKVFYKNFEVIISFLSSMLLTLNILFCDTDFQVKTVKELMASDKITPINSFEMSFVL